ncbi:MAG: Crp/Fnr family transcriptional regulator [Chitinophagaceae bacterium]|jgi:CRP-like cAMP-binding protein
MNSPAPIDILAQALKQISGISAEDFELSRPCWEIKEYKKGALYNDYKQVCKHLGFITEGVFRTYYIDEKGEDKNVFFFSQYQVVVSFHSFINQVPCNYYTEAMKDAQVIYIHINHLQKLYESNHRWEHLGRIIAEMAFNVAMRRTESFLFQSPEQRYLDLIEQHPEIFNSIPLYHISSYLGIQGPSLSRIRKRLLNG